MYKLKKIFKNEKGQGMVEYGLILALVSIVAVLGLSTLGGNIKGQFEGITDSMGDISEPGKVPEYSDEEIDDLIKNHHFIPVATADELNNVRSATSETYGEGTEWVGEYTGGLDKQYIQVADIDLGKFTNFEPIGKNRSEFKGIYDGGGYVISNLTISRGSEDNVGLFGRAIGATFKNVGLEDVDVTGRTWTGGLVGWQQSSSTVSNSYATGSVTGESNVGGLVGHQRDSSSVTDSYATGSVTGSGTVGGLVGYQEGSSTTNSYATGSVNGGSRTGGLVGYQAGSSTVTNSYATGSVTGANNTGGLVGNQYSSSTVSNSYATGSVTGTGGNRTGGLVGSQNTSSITNSYATGSVTGTGTNIGGLVGYQYVSSVTNSYYDTETTGRADTRKGTGKTTAEMKNKDTYTGWDNAIWEFKDDQYPTLR